MWKLLISKNRRRSPEELSEPKKTITSRTDEEDLNTDDDNTCHEQDNRNNSTDTVDALLAQELNALTFQQRESINEEIHGVNVNQIYVDKIKEIEETPELLEASFGKLQVELTKLQPNAFAYNRCQQLYGDDNNGNEDGDVIAIAVVGNTKRKIAYMNTDEFRIKFLRCELFDVPKAARRLINFVEQMYDLYGDIGLQRRIQQDDLSKEELLVLKAGPMQLLPSRDRAGRRIVLNIDYNSTHEFTAKSRLRIAYYIQMALADDIETQRKGGVGIMWLHNVNIFDDWSTRRDVYSKSENYPVRTGAIHICIPEELEDKHDLTIPGFTANKRGSDDSSSGNSSSMTNNNSSGSSPQSRSNGTPANIIKSMFALSIGGKLRSKLRIHTGSAMECLYALQSFGIPTNQMPLVNGITSNKKRKRKNKTKKNDSVVGDDNNNGNLEQKNHTQWLQLCQLKESNKKLYGTEWKCYGKNSHGGYVGHQLVIECPKHSDILSGRGKDIMNHPGNSVLRSIVVSKLDDYMKMKSKGQKLILTLNIVHLLKNEYGARFLKEETIESSGKLGCWIEVPDEQARLKVRIAFRDKIRAQQPQQSDKQKSHDNISSNKNVVGACAGNNTTDNKKKNITNMQHKNEQQKNNNTTSRHHEHIQHQQVEEDIDSSTSVFLNMDGGGNGSSCSGSQCCIGSGSGSGSGSSSIRSKSTGKKRQLQTNV